MTETPAAEPEVAPPEQAPPPGVQVLGRRLLAIIIDTVLFLLLESLLTRPLVPIHLRVQNPSHLGGKFTIGLDHVAQNILPWLVFGVFIYFAFFELLFAATPGKLLSGLRVADQYGNRPSRRAILFRNLVRPIDLIGGYIVGGLVVLVTKRRQRLGDIAGHTIVVGAWSVDWIDRSRSATQRRIGIMGVSILVVVLAGGVLTYLLPPSISPALKDKFYPDDSAVVVTKAPGAQHLLGLSLGSANRSGSTATYVLRATLAVKGSSTPLACTGKIAYHWSGPLDGWTFGAVSAHC